ncbi:GNAT family N-acetyltransferase [Gemmatimonas sp.]
MSSLPPVPEGYSPVPPGYLAAVVTYLEMRTAPVHAVHGEEGDAHALALEPLGAANLDRYRAVYRDVGTPWLWFSRLRLSNDQLRAILADERVQAFAVRDGHRDVGLLELDFRVVGECELAFFGLVNDYVGRGAGRWLMHEAISRAWAQPIRRLHVHTCTLDHPQAVPFYVRSGFTPYARAVEVTPDPRLDGTLPREAAPFAPVIGS